MNSVQYPKLQLAAFGGVGNCNVPLKNCNVPLKNCNVPRYAFKHRGFLEFLACEGFERLESKNERAASEKRSCISSLSEHGKGKSKITAMKMIAPIHEMRATKMKMVPPGVCDRVEDEGHRGVCSMCGVVMCSRMWVTTFCSPVSPPPMYPAADSNVLTYHLERNDDHLNPRNQGQDYAAQIDVSHAMERPMFPISATQRVVEVSVPHPDALRGAAPASFGSSRGFYGR